MSENATEPYEPQSYGLGYTQPYPFPYPEGLPINSTSQGLEAQHRAFTGQGRVLGITISSTRGSGQFIQVFDQSSSTIASGAIPIVSIDIATATAKGIAWDPGGRWFFAGCIVANSTAQGSFTAGSADCLFDVQFIPQVIQVSLITPGGSGGGAGTLGSSALIYRFVISGADKASIDTGADTAQAGSNDWTNGDILEIFMLSRTDEAGASVSLFCTINNDTGTNYNRQRITGNNVTVTSAASVTRANIDMSSHGTGGSASTPASHHVVIPGFGGSTFFKTGSVTESAPDATGANNFVETFAFGWQNTAAITRWKMAATGGQNLKVGSALYVYKRLAA